MIKLKTIFEAGTRPEHSDYLKRKIKLTNQLSFFLSLYVLLFASVFLIFQRLDLFYIAIIALVFYVLPLFLNRYGLWQLARFLMSITPSVVLCFIHTILIEPNEEVIHGLILIQVASLLYPWILYDLRESKLLIISFLIGLLMLAFTFLLNDLIDIHISAGILRGLFFYIFCIVSATSIIDLFLFILQKSNTIAEGRNSILVLEMQKQQHKLYQNEHKLNEYIKEIEKAREDDKVRQWRVEGITKFNELIRREHQQTQKLYDDLIMEMVKQVGANQGGFFVLNNSDDSDDELFLEMAACYAYEKSKYIDKKIYVSEGLMGQAFQDKEPMMLTEVPPQYVHITSGLGKALPRCILIVPLKYNEQVCGMIELASFEVFQPYHVEFVGRVGEIIASAILTAQSNEKTQHLLRETQYQAEQMRAQEEEMRQTVEELSATQEEMQRRQADIENSNQIMKSNEIILKKMIEQFKEKEADYLAKIQALESGK